MPAYSVRTLLGTIVIAAAVTVHGRQDFVFQSGVDLVTVDASVIGRDGRPIAGLTRDDFRLEVDGRPRAVVSAQFVAQLRPGPRPTAAARHFSSNEDAEVGRFVVVAVDEAHIRRLEGRAALTAAARFIDTLNPLDRVAVTGLSRIGIVEFTRDRAALKSRLQSLSGHTDPTFHQFNLGLAEAIEVADGSRSRLADAVLRECGQSLTAYVNVDRVGDMPGGRDACPEQLEQEARAVAQHARTQARISLSALGGLVETLKPLDGPKTVVLLSEGMVVDPRLVDLGQLAAAARDARVTIYALHMEAPLFEASQERISPTLSQDVNLRGDGLSRLAGAARGTVFRLVGSDPRPFERIADEITGYYLLAFEPTVAERDGRTHQIKVSLARGGGQLRARAGFRLPPAPPPPTREADLVAVLRDSRPVTELPVRVSTYTYADPGADRVRLVVSTEADVEAGAASQVVLGYVLVDGRGVITASGATQAAQGRHAFSTVVPAGTYTLRVGGIDQLWRRGLVSRQVTAAVDRSAPLRVSDLILAPVPVPPEAPLQPLVDRVSDGQLTGYVEVVAGPSGELAGTAVSFEIAAAPDADAIAAVPAGLVTKDARFGVARAVLPLDALAPGSYVARARVLVDGVERLRVSRPFTYAPAGGR